MKAAGAVMVCGDQHLGTIVRHGLSSFTDGPVQFTVPAAGTAWQRWFEATNLPHPGSTPHTGDFTDGYGNQMHVLAVSNPAITQAQYVAAYGTATHNFGDRSLKSEGYGIVRIDKTAQQFVLESWRWDTDPTAVGARAVRRLAGDGSVRLRLSARSRRQPMRPGGNRVSATAPAASQSTTYAAGPSGPRSCSRPRPTSRR